MNGANGGTAKRRYEWCVEAGGSVVIAAQSLSNTGRFLSVMKDYKIITGKVAVVIQAETD